MESCYQDYITNVKEYIHNNPNFFWNLPNTMCLKDTVSSEPQVIAEMFENNYSNVFKRNDLKDVIIRYRHNVWLFVQFWGGNEQTEKSDDLPDYTIRKTIRIPQEYSCGVYETFWKWVVISLMLIIFLRIFGSQAYRSGSLIQGAWAGLFQFVCSYEEKVRHISTTLPHCFYQLI